MRRRGGPPDDKPWIWLTVELLGSRSWRERTINCARLIDFLLIEHAKGAGQRNGQLVAPYRQLEEFGIPKRLVAPAIAEAEKRGLIAVKRGARRDPSRFRLTFLPTVETNETSHIVERLPTNDWRLLDVPFDPVLPP